MCTEKKARHDMGFFDFLFKKKEKRTLPERINVVTTISAGPDYYTKEYVDLLLTRPTMQDFWDRSFDFPRYNEVNYYINNLNSDVAKINDLTEKIQILENK